MLFNINPTKCSTQNVNSIVEFKKLLEHNNSKLSKESIFMNKFLAHSWKACQQGMNILVDI